MQIAMVKKRLADGNPCEKCVQTEAMLRRRGFWHHVDQVIWALEDDPESEGALVAGRHGVKVAPFFVLTDDAGHESVVTSPLKLIRDVLSQEPEPPHATAPELTALPGVAAQLAESEPVEILRWGLERYGDRCAIHFRGAEDVALIDMATKLDLPFAVFCLDTGRLNPETYTFIDDVRRHYGIEVDVFCPDAEELARLVNRKGPNSFFVDGHTECCGVRKLAPLRRALASFDAWASSSLAGELSAVHEASSDAPAEAVHEDTVFKGASGSLVRLNPLARWSRDRVWTYIREHGVPTNALHEQGYRSIDCAPCTRPVSGEQLDLITPQAAPGEPDRWWWEAEADSRS